MSEVNDAVQVVMVTGKGAYLLGKLSFKSALLILKLLNTIYMAKWKGKASLRRFRQIKGDDYTFINIGTEDKSKLKAIEKEMKAHGILYAKLPDLCGGDGQTQYVISPADAAKFKAFLLDHTNGKYRDIKMGPISPEDYAKTGIDKNGKETSELKGLMESAEKEMERSGENRKEKEEKITIETKHGKITVDKDQVDKISDYVPNFKLREAKAKGIGGSLIEQEPLKMTERWGMYQMPDGIHAVIVPKSDIIDRGIDPGSGKKKEAALVYYNKSYRVVNLKDRQLTPMNGNEVDREMKRPGIKERNLQAQDLKRNKGKVSKDFVRSAGQVRG